jgi:hypothetical protein
MFVDIPADIIAKVRRDFLENEAVTVLELLSEFHKENPDISERVLRCIVFLAKGNFEEFVRAIGSARVDWRDLIVAAEYDGWSGEENRRRDLNVPFKA